MLIDIRSFQLSTAAEPVGDVELTAKIVGTDGKIIKAQTFHATAPARSADAAGAAAALNEAFQQAATDLVAWAASTI